MITGFEDLTKELTKEELEIVPILVAGFKRRSKLTPIKSVEVIEKCNEHFAKNGLKIKLTDVRLRKICNYIRSNSIIPLIATSKGYYVSYEEKEIQSQIESFMGRAKAIEKCALGMKSFIQNK